MNAVRLDRVNRQVADDFAALEAESVAWEKLETARRIRLGADRQSPQAMDRKPSV